MREWRGRCHRCCKATGVHTMSRFNEDLICVECEDREQEHPQYKAAADAELAAVKAGDMNFPGVGKPNDL